MNSNNRGSLVAGVILIGLGLLFFLFNVIPGFRIGALWPMIFIALAAGFFVPPLIWQEHRQGLSGLFIPGAIMLMLGLIFFYNTFTGDWASWAYAWTLIPGGVGLGLWLGSWYGRWGRDSMVVGQWMLAISVLVFGLFGMLFGSQALKIAGPILLILGGLLLMVRAFRKPAESQPTP